MNNPFDLANYKPQVKFSDLEKARRNAYQAARYVNEQRKQGKEPSNPYAERNDAHMAGLPQDYTIDMPAMPMNKKALKRKEKREKEKQQ